jgi:hypothetical protein
MKTCSIGQTLRTCDVTQWKNIKDVPKIKHIEYGFSIGDYWWLFYQWLMVVILKPHQQNEKKIDTKFPQNQLSH